MREWEVEVMRLLKWKLALPLLYDEVMLAANLWGQYHSDKPDFALSFSPVEHHNHLVGHIKVCLYNYDHLIQHNSLDSLSIKTKKIALALFCVSLSTVAMI